MLFTEIASSMVTDNFTHCLQIIIYGLGSNYMYGRIWSGLSDTVYQLQPARICDM